MNQSYRFIRSGAVLALASFAALPFAAGAQQRQVPDTYTAVTTNMSPADVELKADILQWSSADDRAAVIGALTEADDPVEALQALPTLGVVWRDGSAVGHAIKYAHRETAADGSETITLVTDKRIGSTSFTPWTVDTAVVETPPDYSVIEMRTDGTGSMSLGAAVLIDPESNLVSLDAGSAAPLLTNVTKQPMPYWASND